MPSLPPAGDHDVVVAHVLDRSLLACVRGAAEAHVDDVGPGVDGPRDPFGDVAGETAAVGAEDLHGQDLRPGAAPAIPVALLLLAAMVPATWVPCPLKSSVPPIPGSTGSPSSLWRKSAPVST